MRSLKNSFSFEFTLAITAIALVGIAAAAFSVAQAVRTRSVATGTLNVESQVQSAVPKPTPLQVELVTITPRGFEPAAISRSGGRFLLSVDNRSGLDEVTLRIDRVAGDRLREARVPRKELDWSEVADLTPGQYVLTEASHPQWVCRFTIAER